METPRRRCCTCACVRQRVGLLAQHAMRRRRQALGPQNATLRTGRVSSRSTVIPSVCCTLLPSWWPDVIPHMDAAQPMAPCRCARCSLESRRNAAGIGICRWLHHDLGGASAGVRCIVPHSHAVAHADTPPGVGTLRGVGSRRHLLRVVRGRQAGGGVAYVGLVCGGAGTHTSLCCACLLSMFYGGHDGSGDADDHTPPAVGVLWRGVQVGDVFASMPSVPLRVRRMDWSPDGRGLVATAAYKEPQYVAPLISRESWAVNAAFVGHTKPVVAARFNRAMFRAVGGSDDADAAASYCCCAFGGQDTAVTVWVTHLPRPLAVISNLFEDTVTDLAWCGCRGVAQATTTTVTCCVWLVVSHLQGRHVCPACDVCRRNCCVPPILAGRAGRGTHASGAVEAAARAVCVAWRPYT